MTPEFALKHGADFPFDAPEGWGEPDWEKRDPLPPKDWAHAAARGVLADITDRRGVRQALDDVDHEIPGRDRRERGRHHPRRARASQ
jgi:hypothetical protein